MLFINSLTIYLKHTM